MRNFPDRYRLIVVISLLLTAGFLATSVTSYYSSKATIHHEIVANELPLTSDTIFSEIQRDLVRPILVSSTMAQDTFVRDWILGGENNPTQITKYLETVRAHYGAFTSFLISEKTRRYYQSKGVLKVVREDEPRDVWYFRVRRLKEAYEINVDPDMANADKLTIFINYRILDYNGQLLGVTGVGLTVDAVSRRLQEYHARYGRRIYFLDADGKVVLSDNGDGGRKVHAIDGISALADQILANHGSARYQYQSRGNTHLLNVRYIPDLKWFLCVERIEEEALGEIRRALLINLAAFLLVTATVLVLVGMTISRHHRRMEELATTDALTGLINRRALDLHLTQALEEARRKHHPVAAIMIDIDHFKRLNDEHGHLCGDQILHDLAALVRDNLRQSDMACRWGGEELFILLKEVDEKAAATVAEKIRSAVEEARFTHKGISHALTISLGVAQFQDADDAVKLIANADKALYEAKHGGRNRVCRASAVA